MALFGELVSTALTLILLIINDFNVIHNNCYRLILAKLVEIAFGIKKLQIMCVVEDDKVSVDALVETIQEFEDYVQSVDIAAFNKI